RKVHAGIFKHAHLALGLETDPAGSGIHYAPVRETDTRVADVDFVRKHGCPDSIDGLDGGAHDGLNDVDVMNHEIQNDVYVGATLAVRRQAMAFDKPR